jgi:hypothetical protein
LATGILFRAYNGVSKTIARRPALSLPLNAVRVAVVMVPSVICAINNMLDMPITPSWLKVEHSSFEKQRTAFTAALITKFCSIPMACWYVMLSSNGVVLVPACMFYTAYTLTGTTSERERNQYI